MKILLTGATGGIGMAIQERLRDHDITCVARTTTHTRKEFDWLICAHGIINEENVYETFRANTISTIQLTQKIKAKKIILIASTAGIKGNTRYPIYSASKGALITYGKSIHNCYILCPGATDTPGWRKLNITDVKPQSPTDVADAVAHIMNGDFKNGDIITVRDGVISCDIY